MRVIALNQKCPPDGIVAISKRRGTYLEQVIALNQKCLPDIFGPIVYRLGHLVLIQESGVRLSVGSPKRELVRALEKGRKLANKKLLILSGFLL